jgi:rhodanese-related sulfurtransferase
MAASEAPRETIEERLRRVQSRITRFEPGDALEANGRGALLVDLRSVDERERHGMIPGSIHIPRSVLEWRLDPESGYQNPAVADLERELILFCAEGFSSSLAVESARELGFRRVGDLVGGFTGWEAAGLPVQPATRQAPNELPGMGTPS